MDHHSHQHTHATVRVMSQIESYHFSEITSHLPISVTRLG